MCSGATEHAEAVRIEFDPALVSYADLVEFFYRTHDPTTVNRQGGDVGTREWLGFWFLILKAEAYRLEYRSAIFTTTEEQAATAQRVTEEVQAKHFTPKVRFSARSTFIYHIIISPAPCFHKHLSAAVTSFLHHANSFSFFRYLNFAVD